MHARAGVRSEGKEHTTQSKNDLKEVWSDPLRLGCVPHATEKNHSNGGMNKARRLPMSSFSEYAQGSSCSEGTTEGCQVRWKGHEPQTLKQCFSLARYVTNLPTRPPIYKDVSQRTLGEVTLTRLQVLWSR